MSSLSDIGNLMHLYLDEIDPDVGTDAPEFLIKATAHLLNQNGKRNWIPVIVKEIDEDKYKVVGNSFIYAVAEEAGLDRVWCIIADDSDETTEITKVLAGEEIPKINLSKASRDEIMAALQYLIEQPGSLLKTVKLPLATNRIDEAPRQYWKTFDPITSLKCGITKGKKLDALKQVFYLTPQPMPDTITDIAILKTMTTADLKKIAKKRGIAGLSKMKKDDLIEALSGG
ncbi:Rho termination factor N-terminal domain-containing protein [Oculatella sp. FACHB-28]|uniref:Rho termination factor N-terminal domain-containing protein n=1 Tax=Oculatella sp. FACHB-28 TaxID=2692845 RepID=UPI001684A186|nr:Rho termination factor N-terminal domain-containing protein [Oculatella sp. FACHB-28]MBD1866189.1 Rho termination factor N-terminal domain-containing protein [Cyanobacteria bacterium FACHB-471]MBD2060572.1 Rho termination factor N-terminal domain-containing protein [Oculatella sp. FACHB-28]